MLSVVGDAICAPCHAGSDVAPKIGTMQSSIVRGQLQIDTASDTLTRAERAGMEVSKAKFNLQEAHAQIVKARVFVHAFNHDKITEASR